MTTSDRYCRLAQAATKVREDADLLLGARPSRAALQLLQSAEDVERELWASFVLALGEEIGRAAQPNSARL